MEFEIQKTGEEVGKKLGFLFSYVLFSTILFFALTFFEKMPAAWNYKHILGITAGITIFGFFLKRWLA